MATKICLGGDISQNASWSPTNVPTSGDSIYFNASTAAITAGYTALAAVDPAKVVVSADCTVALGDASNYIQFNDITRLDINNAAAVYIQCDALTNAYVWGSGAAINLKGLNALACANLEVLGGSSTLTIIDGTVTLLRISDAPTMTVSPAAAMTALTTVEADSGTLQLSEPPVTMRLYDAARATILAGIAGTVTTYVGTGSSVLTHLGTTTITTATLFKTAQITFEGNYSTASTTITTANLFGTSTINTQSGTGNVAITTTNTRGGKVI